MYFVRGRPFTPFESLRAGFDFPQGERAAGEGNHEGCPCSRVCAALDKLRANGDGRLANGPCGAREWLGGGFLDAGLRRYDG